MEPLWSPVVATGSSHRQIDCVQTRRNEPNPLPPAATGWVRRSMVRRGSPVRVRKRALQKLRMSALFRSGGLAPRRTCGGYGASDGAFSSTRAPQHRQDGAPTTSPRRDRRRAIDAQRLSHLGGGKRSFASSGLSAGCSVEQNHGQLSAAVASYSRPALTRKTLRPHSRRILR